MKYINLVAKYLQYRNKFNEENNPEIIEITMILLAVTEHFLNKIDPYFK